MLQDNRQNHHCPSIAKHVKKRAEWFQQGAKDEKLPMQRSRLNYSICPNGTSDPKTLCKLTYCQIVQWRVRNVLTAIDVFSPYLNAYPLTDASAINVAKVVIDILTKHAFLPITMNTDKGTVFTSTIIAEI